VKVDASGHSADFTPSNKIDLLPLCGLRVKVEDHSLWAAGCQESGHGELYHFSRDGQLIERIRPATSGKHLFNDLVLGRTSEIYVTDILANQVYRFDCETHVFTALSFPRPLYYPNGIRTIKRSYTSLTRSGVLPYDLKTSAALEIDPGLANTSAGFDGIYWYHGVQNGMGLPRIVEVRLSQDGRHVRDLKVLEYRSSQLILPTTGVVKGSQLYFIENAQIDNFKDGKIVDPGKLESVRIGVVELQQPQKREPEFDISETCSNYGTRGWQLMMRRSFLPETPA
jgi:hypothetical protein